MEILRKITINKNAPIPIYQQILNEIRTYIASGEWPANTQIPTEAELEAELQVSRVTIRQALSAAVEEGLVIRIPGKGTFVSGAAISAATPTTGSFIGYVVPHISSSFNVQILLGVETILKQEGFHLIFCNSEGDLSKENQLLEDLQANKMAGYIIQPVYSNETNRSIVDIASKGGKLVFIDRSIPGVKADSVMSNHFEGGQQIVRHLIDQGYRDIVYLAREPLGLFSIAERLRGYEAAMVTSGLKPRPPLVVGGPIELGYVQNQNSPTLEEKSVTDTIGELLQGPARPEAIVAMNDLVAISVFEAAAQAGLRIPHDLALVGFDNLDYADTHNLTTVAQRPFEIGNAAARLLLSRICSNSNTIEQILLPTQLVIRGSSINPDRVSTSISDPQGGPIK
jgi:DNA-binding LacI/PurR family transcriptional regulator